MDFSIFSTKVCEKKRAQLQTLFCDVYVHVCPERGVIEMSPNNASIDAILDTRGYKCFDTFSTILQGRTLPCALITIKHAFLIH